MKILLRKAHIACAAILLGLVGNLSAQNAVKDTNPINDIMFQSFGWDEFNQDRHVNGFYNFYLNQTDYLSEAGIDMVWMPPPSQSTGGVGYIPTQLFNFTKTAWGTEAELKAVLAKFKSKGMYSLADVVVNHRGGTTGWMDFTNPKWSCKTVVSNDEAVDKAEANPKPCGTADTGTGFDAGRDLDHTQQETRDGVKEFLTVLKGVGFDGWRWDVAKGFSAQYFGEYNAASKPYYSVGEYWDGGTSTLKNWVDGTNKNSGAFDFANYYQLSAALRNNSYGVLNIGGRMPGLAGVIGYDDKAVPFVDNHDTFTGSEAILGDNVMKGYAYILTHPGIPCVWAAHYYGGSYTKDGVTRTYGDNQLAINKLMGVRKQNGINAYSSVSITQSGGTYVAYVSPTFGAAATVVVKLGGGNFDPGAGWILNVSGTDYAVWSKKTITTPSIPGAAEISIGVVGIGVGGLETDWSKDIVMTSTDNENYTLASQSFVGGAVKFRANAAWTLNWGGATFPAGTGVVDGTKNITVPAGTYKVEFNRKTAAYKFTLLGEACTCAADPVVVCANGVEYANACTAKCAGITNFTVGKCVVVDPCTVCTGTTPVCANGVEYPNECKAKCAGITNYTIGACPVVVYPKIGMVGSAVNDDATWNTDEFMSTTDGITYTLTYTFKDGKTKFRQDAVWTVNDWGSSSFPSGTGTKGGVDIPVTAGAYDVKFNRTTGAYSFAKSLGVDDYNFGNAEISVSPNPSSDNWNVASSEEVKSVQVLDIYGKVVLTTNTSVISGSNLSTGIYFAVIATQNSVKTIKLIKK